MKLLRLKVTRHEVMVAPVIYFFRVSATGEGREFREILSSVADLMNWVRWMGSVLGGCSDFFLDHREFSVPEEVSSIFVEYFPPAEEKFEMLSMSLAHLHPSFLPTLLSGPGTDGERRRFVLWPSEKGEMEEGRTVVRPVPAENFLACTPVFQEMVARMLDHGHHCILKLV